MPTDRSSSTADAPSPEGIAVELDHASVMTTDLDEAVKGVVDSAFGYSGQKCSAGSRAIVLSGIYDQFLARLVEATKSLTVAPADA